MSIDWDQTGGGSSPDLTVAGLFERQAVRTPEAVAVTFHDRQLTYRELSAQANQVAQRLRRLGVGPEVVVGLYLERSVELVVGLLAILKAGGAYLPIDTGYPEERIAFMLKDSGASVILTQAGLAQRLPDHGAVHVTLDADLSLTDEPVGNPEARVTGDNLAYVIYTSGSTGRPKGVAMVHRALVNLLAWHESALPVKAGERVLQFTSISFDVSFQEIFSTWCGGGTLVLMRDEVRRDPASLWSYLQGQGIHRLFLPYVALHQLAEAAHGSADTPENLREVITAGEQLQITPKILALFRRLPAARLHNHYGPTETHVVTAYTLPDDRSGWAALPPIGQAISNTTIHLLDEQFRAVPDGATGELYIGGHCLSRGYLHHPELTEERFVRGPVGPNSGPRLYRTGDLARCLPDGNLEFLGRADAQIKIRGYRVEPGEIETLLAQHPSVREAVVVGHGNGVERRLVAYVVPRAGLVGSSAELRSFLQARLAEYMVPARFEFLDQLPLTPSGKVDRRALPEPHGASDTGEGGGIGLRNGLERTIAEAWRRVLDLAHVGAQQNFFDLGGTSLTVVQLQQVLRETLHRELAITTLFQYPTVAALADHLNATPPAGAGMDQAVRERAARQRDALARSRTARLGGRR